jgi:hypothetical protein
MNLGKKTMPVCSACEVAFPEDESHVCQKNAPLAGPLLIKRMVVLSIPSFIAIAGYVFGWVFSLLGFPGREGSLAPLGVVWLFALQAQLLTVPLAAVALVRGIKRGPRASLPRVIVLFCVCLAGSVPMVVFVIGYIFFSSGP